MDRLFALFGRVLKLMLGLMFLLFTVSLAALFLALAMVSWFVQRLLGILTGRPVQPTVQWIQIIQRAQAFRRGPFGQGNRTGSQASGGYSTDHRPGTDDVVDVQAREVKEDAESVPHAKR